jgi:hypothetical protein
MFEGVKNFFGGKKSEEVENNEHLVKSGVGESKDPYSQDYVENVKVDEAGVAMPHDVHMAKNEAMMGQGENKEDTEEQKVDIAA